MCVREAMGLRQKLPRGSYKWSVATQGQWCLPWVQDSSSPSSVSSLRPADTRRRMCYHTTNSVAQENWRGSGWPTTFKLMLMPGRKSRAGVLGHEGEMRCSLQHLYHWGGLHTVPILVSLQGQSKRRCSTFIRTSGKWAAHSLPGRVWEKRGENPVFSAIDYTDDNSYHDRLAERVLCALQHLKKRMQRKAQKQGNDGGITNK